MVLAACRHRVQTSTHNFWREGGEKMNWWFINCSWMSNRKEQDGERWWCEKFRCDQSSIWKKQKRNVKRFVHSLFTWLWIIMAAVRGEKTLKKAESEQTRKALRCDWRINICIWTSPCDLFIFIHINSSSHRGVPSDPLSVLSTDECQGFAVRFGMFVFIRRYLCSSSKLFL